MTATGKMPKFVWVLLGLCVLGALMTLFPNDDNDAPTAESVRLSAEKFCQDSVEKRLRSPSSAKHPALGTASVAGSDPYTVRSYVDADNGFGANVRTSYTCTVARSGATGLLLTSLVLDE